jgi:D-glycero-alpha-D-manno-heptose-7-phosphate kinase
VLYGQRDRIPGKIAKLHELSGMVPLGRQCLVDGDIEAVGRLLHEAWQCKKSLSPEIGFEGFDTWYCAALEQGAFGGELLAPAVAGSCSSWIRWSGTTRYGALLAGLDEMPVSFVSGGSQIGGPT